MNQKLKKIFNPICKDSMLKDKFIKKSFYILINNFSCANGNSLNIILMILFNMVFAGHRISHAQSSQNVNIIPPSPISSNIQRYGDYPISHFTGVPEINIPIYEINAGGIKLPIGISYHASGIKVNDHHYPVGLGWSLNYGGRISRTIRDLPDEAANKSYRHLMYTEQTRFGIDQTFNFFDKEPDVFYYNFGISGSSSGRFIFDGAKRDQAGGTLVDPVFFPSSKIKFDYLKSNIVSFSKGISEIYLTDDEGTKFSFGGNAPNTVETGGTSTNIYDSAWLLTEIVPSSQNTSDKIKFGYVSGAYASMLTAQGSMDIIDSVNFTSGINMPSGFSHFDKIFGHYRNGSSGYSYNSLSKIKRADDRATSLTYVSNVMEGNVSSFYTTGGNAYTMSNIDEINFKEGKVKFNYDGQLKLLTSIVVTNLTGEQVRKAELYYSSYNSWERYKLDSVLIIGSAGSIPMKYSFLYEYGIDGPKNILAQDYWGYYNNQISNTSPIPKWNGVKTLALYKNNNLHDYLDVDIGTANRNPAEDYSKAFMLKQINYPTGGYTKFEFEINKYLDKNNVLTDAGGLRIKQIKSYAGFGDPLIKTYNYGLNNSQAGSPIKIPEFSDWVIERTMLYGNLAAECYSGEGNLHDCYPPSIPFSARKRTFLSSPSNDLNFTDGCSVWYTHVEESTSNLSGESIGKTIYEYELPAAHEYANFYNDQQRLNSKYILTFRGYTLPHLRAKTDYKTFGNSLIPIHATKCEYIDRGGPMAYSFSVHKNVSYNEGISTNYYNVMDQYNYSLYTDGNPEIHSTTYRLASQKEIDYSINTSGQLDSIVLSKEYTYANGIYPSEIHFESSDGLQKRSVMKYPIDYIGITALDSKSQGLKLLQEGNVLSKPVEQVTISNGLVSNALLNTFKPHQPLLDNVHKMNIQKPLTSFSFSGINNGAFVSDSSYEQEFTIDRYNESGGVLQCHNSKNINISYLWDIKNEHPILEVKNADYSLIESILGSAAILSFRNLYNPDKATVDAFIAPIKANLPNAQITTFTYKPLVGMTSMTDAKGMTTYYEYDSFQRLKAVRDQHGNLLKQTDYHYKN